MKKKKNQKSSEPQVDRRGRPTLLEFLSSLYLEANEQFGTQFEIDPDIRATPLPTWGKKTMTRLGKTILKPLFKLRPKKKVTCQHFGQIIGVLGRAITFYRIDAPRLLEDEGLNEISKEKWELIQPRDQSRALVVKRLGRPVADTESLEDLEAELLEKRLKNLDEMQANAFRFMAGRSAKDNGMFLKGVAQGYAAFLDMDGAFCGDRGRTEIYTELLSSVHEIEKMRRMLPARNDSHLYEHLRPWYKFPAPEKKARKWLRDVCDDISLRIKGSRGRPHNFLEPQNAS